MTTTNEQLVAQGNKEVTTQNQTNAVQEVIDKLKSGEMKFIC